MDLLSLPVLQADHRLRYGPDPSQFGDLWLPAQPPAAGAPVVVFFHGGWWKSAYDLGYAGYLCQALKQEGVSVWSLEYRRVGSTGGGWPTTFQDAAHGLEFLGELAKRFPLNLGNVISAGHSAGGHLAFWVAGRSHIDSHSELFLPRPAVALRGSLALAGAVGLEMVLDLAGDGLFAHDREEVLNLMGGGPTQVPLRYHAGDPGELLPLSCPQYLLQGTDDDQIPPALPELWAKRSRRVGGECTVKLLPGADHFDVVDPRSRAWPEVLRAVQYLLA